MGCVERCEDKHGFMTRVGWMWSRLKIDGKRIVGKHAKQQA